MRFLTHGDANAPALMLIHGMANTPALFDPILPYLRDYYVIVCELDGHSEEVRGEFRSVDDSCEKIEAYVWRELDGKLCGLLGFSLGGTIAVELLSRGKITVEKTILDAAFNVSMGIMTFPFKWMFQTAVACVKMNIRVPRFMVEMVMGKGNGDIVKIIYRGVSQRSVSNACLSVYRYEMKDSIRKYQNPIVFWYGTNEYFPVKSAKLLRQYLPQLQKRVFKDMGHGQLLHEHPRMYAKRMRSFLADA